MAFAYPAVAADPVLTPGIQAQLALPEDKIDVADAALVFAKAIDPAIDIDAYSAKIDRLADEVRLAMGPSATADAARDAMIAVIYGKEGYRYDFSPGAMTDPRNLFLTGILDTKLGTCVTLPMLYMAVAQRAGLPVYPVMAPQHNFLRTTDRHATYPNIEATSGGGTISDVHLIQRMHISDTAIKAGTYMRTMTYREYMGELLALNGTWYMGAGQTDRAVAYNATPGIGGEMPFNLSPVKSYCVTNKLDGKKVTVTATMGDHPLFPGILVRETKEIMINNWGEGTSELQSPTSRIGVFGPTINSV